MLWFLWGRLKGYLLGVAGIFAAIAYVYAKGRNAGRDAADAQAEKKLKKVQEKWDEIDARPADFDAAIDRLRDRSKG